MEDEVGVDEIGDDVLEVAYRAVRNHADRSGYGTFISDDECRAVAREVVMAVKSYAEKNINDAL